MTTTDEPIDANAELMAFVENACAEITEMRAEMQALRDDWERFRGKMMRDFIALVDEYRGVDLIRSQSADK